MNRPRPNQNTDLDTAASPRQPVELPDAVAETNYSATALQANKADCARPSLAETDPLLSLLRSGMLPPVHVVSGMRNAKAEKARMEKEESKRAKVERDEFERVQAEKVKFKKAQIEAARLENAAYEKKVHFERAKFARLRAQCVKPKTAQSGNANSDTPPQAGSLVSLLRKEMLATAPDVSGKRNAKTERARLEMDRFDQANPEKTEPGNAKSEKVQFENERSEDAESETSLLGGSAHSGWFSIWAVGVTILVLACVAGVFYLRQGGLFR